ncbi:ATP-binding protein [Pseudoflavonifractor phocaeensis]|uniref:ATP-binding protein n=1 Tax=Pseudoflavonifractor phocaeensis TaxID=1870988 RepID=UPI001F2A0964|nr:ATP-binding protein [Pseudoflavonifractor phocaeensis]MCF2661707.1 ATP-binding protein [Pseudoflavonifractor phocaeensis]
MELNALRAALRGLSAYREIKDRPVMAQTVRLLDALAHDRGEDALDAYTGLFYLLRQEGFSGLGAWLWDYLRYTESPYALLAERGGSDPALESAARRDVDTLVLLAGTDCDRYIDAMKDLLPSDYAPVLAGLPRWRAAAPFDFDALTRFYREHGAGLYARYRAFLWENGQLVPVPDPDCPMPEDLLGYELQRDQVEANTRQLVAGHPANNVLLFGDGGTGKSATVKSMLYLPGMEDLRLIEIQKENLTGLPQLMRSLGGRRQKFILFIDDLAFDQDDKTYSSLKTILEGSLEKRPVNVAIYATSNRRHLVRQNFSDRGSDEVDAAETISEKTALAERFGLRIPYLTMNKASYLALVDHLAAQAGIQMAPEILHAQAMTWEIRHSGRTPRVARQFIASLHQ